MREWVAVTLFVVACGPTPHQMGADDDGDPLTRDAQTSTMWNDAAIDSQCGAQMQNIGVVNLGDPPDLLVVLDRSGSMTATPPSFPPVFDSKWNIMRSALNSIAVQKDQNIKFGLLEFPSDENCAADATAEVGIALGTHPQIATYFAG